MCTGPPRTWGRRELCTKENKTMWVLELCVPLAWQSFSFMLPVCEPVGVEGQGGECKRKNNSLMTALTFQNRQTLRSRAFCLFCLSKRVHALTVRVLYLGHGSHEGALVYVALDLLHEGLLVGRVQLLGELDGLQGGEAAPHAVYHGNALGLG